MRATYGHDARGVGERVRDAGQPCERGHLAVDVTPLGEGGHGALPELEAGLRIRDGGRDRAEQEDLGLRVERRRQQRAPELGQRGVLGRADLHERPAHRAEDGVPRARLDQEADGPVVVAPCPRVDPTPAPDVGESLGRLAGQDRLGHHVVELPPAGLGPAHQRHVGEQRLQRHRLTGHGGRELVVGTAERSQLDEAVEGVLPDRADDLLPDVLTDRHAGGAREQLGERGPALGRRELLHRDATRRGEGGDLVGVEPQVVLAQHHRFVLYRAACDTDLRKRPRPEEHVRVAGESIDQSGEQRHAVGTRRDLVHVVEDEADRRRRARPRDVHDAFDQLVDVGTRRRFGAELREQPTREMRRARVGPLEPEVDVDAEAREPVLADRLGDQGGLAEPGPGDDRGDRPAPATLHDRQQSGAGERVRDRDRRLVQDAAVEAVTVENPAEPTLTSTPGS